MKKFLLWALCFVASLGLLTSCKKATINGIEVSNYTEIVLKGTDLKGLKLTALFDDDTKGDLIDVTTEMISGYDKTKTGYQTVKVTYENQEFTYKVYVADKIVSNAKELRDALKTQKDGEVIAIKNGTYDIDRDNETKYADQAGYYFLVTANNLTFKGFGSVIIKSSVESENTVLASQNFVTIAGNNTTLEDLTLQCKKEPNKVVEIIGKDTTLRNIKIEPMSNLKFAGSIYLSTKAGNTTLENVNLKYGRITTTGASDSTLTLKNVTIDFANAVLGEQNIETSLWGFDNSRSNISVTATDSKIIVSATLKADPKYQSFTNQLPKGLTVEEAK